MALIRGQAAEFAVQLPSAVAPVTGTVDGVALDTEPVQVAGSADSYTITLSADEADAAAPYLLLLDASGNEYGVTVTTAEDSAGVTTLLTRITAILSTRTQDVADKDEILAAVVADVPDGWVTITGDSWPDGVAHTTANKLGPVKVNGVTRAGVLVQAIGSDGAGTNATTTDGAGGFTLPVPTGDTYTVRFTYDGAISEEGEVTV